MIALFGLAPPAHVLATMLVPLGVRVVDYDPAVHRNAELWRRLGVQPMALTDMLEVADAVSVQTIYASRYRGLVSERVLESCKPGQLWTSISRPSLFDLPALANPALGPHQRLHDGQRRRTADRARLAAARPDQPAHHAAPGTVPQESQLRGSWYLADRIHETLLLGGNCTASSGPPTASRCRWPERRKGQRLPCNQYIFVAACRHSARISDIKLTETLIYQAQTL